jgi:hypothetical protein
VETAAVCTILSFAVQLSLMLTVLPKGNIRFLSRGYHELRLCLTSAANLAQPNSSPFFSFLKYAERKSLST